MKATYDVMGLSAQPYDLEVVMGGATVKFVRKGLSMLFVDRFEGKPTRHAAREVNG